MVPFHMLCVVSYYCAIATLPVFVIFDFKNTLKTGLRVREGHRICHHSIESLWLPTHVLL